MIKLYKNPLNIHVGRAGHGVPNSNMPTSNSDFVVHKGGVSNIDFTVTNNDRKPIHLVGKKVSIIIMDRHSGDTVLEKVMKQTNPHEGICQATFTPNDFAYTNPTSYRYTVLLTNEDGQREFLYTDQNHTVSGYMELKNAALPNMKEPIEIEMIPDQMVSNMSGRPLTRRYTAGSYRCGDGITTIAVYLEKFHGKFWVEGTLEDSATADESLWFNIDLGSLNGEYWQFNGESGIESFNIAADAQWIRFVIEPDDLLNGVKFEYIGQERNEGDGRMSKILLRT